MTFQATVSNVGRLTVILAALEKISALQKCAILRHFLNLSFDVKSQPLGGKFVPVLIRWDNPASMVSTASFIKANHARLA